MNKTEIIEQIAKDADISKDKARKAVNSMMSSIQTSLSVKEGVVRLTGFGTFSKVHRKPRDGRNPSTGEKIAIKARNVVKFRPGKLLKEAIL
jgi:DNA-binding protein HU-beta